MDDYHQTIKMIPSGLYEHKGNYYFLAGLYEHKGNYYFLVAGNGGRSYVVRTGRLALDPG